MNRFKHKYLALIVSFFMAISCLQAQQPPANGPYTSYHSNGKVHEKGQYKEGKKHGIWKRYDTYGNVVLKEKYKEGKPLWQIVYEKGKIIRTIDKEGRVRERAACGC